MTLVYSIWNKIIYQKKFYNNLEVIAFSLDLIVHVIRICTCYDTFGYQWQCFVYRVMDVCDSMFVLLKVTLEGMHW